MKIRIKNECELAKINSIFQPIIREAIDAYLLIFDISNIFAIHLMGSVPRGDARQGNSDIDFICLHKNEITELQKISVNVEAKRLSEKYNQVRCVDLECNNFKKLHPSKEFILKTDSISVYGKDTYQKKLLDIDSTEVANNTTPDLDYLIEKYKTEINGLNETIDLKQYSRWIGKDILKCFRYRFILENGTYEKSPNKIYERLVLYYPDDEMVFTKLIDLYLNPVNSKDLLNEVLDRVLNIKDKYRKRATNNCFNLAKLTFCRLSKC